jgi:hypothetical protein
MLPGKIVIRRQALVGGRDLQQLGEFEDLRLGSGPADLVSKKEGRGPSLQEEAGYVIYVIGVGRDAIGKDEPLLWKDGPPNILPLENVVGNGQIHRASR